MYDHEAKSNSHTSDNEFDSTWHTAEETPLSDPFFCPDYAPSAPAPAAESTTWTLPEYDPSHNTRATDGHAQGFWGEGMRWGEHSGASSVYTEEWESLPSPTPVINTSSRPSNTAAHNEHNYFAGSSTEWCPPTNDSVVVEDIKCDLPNDGEGSLCEGSPYSYPYRSNMGPTADTSAGVQCGECSNLLNQLGETLDALENAQRVAADSRQQLDIMRGNMDLLVTVEDCELVEVELVNSLKLIKNRKVSERSLYFHKELNFE